MNIEKNIAENIMPNKIIEIITEPSKIFVGSVFKLKTKAVRYITYNELKTKGFTYNNLKGE